MYTIQENLKKNLLNNLIRNVTKVKYIERKLLETMKKDYVV